MKTYGELLAEAAQVVEKRGLFKGDFEDYPGGPVCMLGTMNVALTGDADNEWLASGYADPAVVADAIGLGDIPMWNDEEDRTKKDVVKALKLAAWVLDDTPLMDVAR